MFMLSDTSQNVAYKLPLTFSLLSERYQEHLKQLKPRY